MKFKFLAKTADLIKAFLGLEEIPINAEEKSVNFSKDQEAKLKEKFGDEFLANVISAFNEEIKAMHDDNLEMKAIHDEIKSVIAQAKANEDLEKNGINASNSVASNQDLLKEFTALAKDQQTMINKLMKEDIGDVAEMINKNGLTAIQHSATHLFASGKEYDALDRPWNKNAVTGAAKATDFTATSTIEKLNGDINLYYRQNPTQVNSLHRDNFGLPLFWNRRTKVDDRVADGSIATAEITQARKLSWLPKNKQLIKPEEGKIFPIQIDIEHVGYELQKIEASWLNMMNKEGSQAYKMSFVQFLLSELDKKARVEDRVATIKGIYVETPEDATEAGRFINRQNGLLYLAQQARDIDKKYRPFDLGVPTSTNIIDYIDNFIKKLPHEVRVQQGLVFYLSDEWLRAYKRRYEQLYGANNDYNGYPMNPKDYSNIKFEMMPDFSGTDFMFLTYDNNIEILENLPEEKSLYRFEYLKRMMYIFADYKLGVRFIHIGNKVEAGDPHEFAVQTVWSNNVPVFPKDTFVPLHEDGLTKINLSYNNIYVAKNRTSTITEIENKQAYAGQIVKIKGNTALSSSLNVVDDDSKLKLTSNFNLKSGGTLTLYIPADGGVPFEISRTTAPESTVVTNAKITSNVIDANDGTIFEMTAFGNTTLANIIGGVEGKTIKLIGLNGTNVLTVNSVGNIVVSSSAVLNASNDSLELTLIDGAWVETSRVITV